MNNIPLVDLRAQYETIREEIRAAVDEVLESCAYVQGPYLEKFENEFAELYGVSHALGCSNGTSAISLALEALGIGLGDEVITVSHTFFATAEAVCNVGAKPVFVDIDPETYCMDVSLLEAAITPQTKAIMPVHIYGNVCDMDPLMAIAEKHGLKIVEDCAQAHLATYNGKMAGTLGDAATFSFYPGKNLGAYGDAGMTLCKDPAVAERIKKLRNHGRLSKYEHDTIGYNHRMDGLQGAVLSVKLRHLPAWTERRQELAALYDEQLREFKRIVPTAGAKMVYHLYVIEVDRRDELIDQLKQQGISAGVHYPIPLHLQPAFLDLGYEKGSLPVTERAAERIVSLPIFPELSDDNAMRICCEVKSFVG